ncbi:RluA family pseudouridine synthase [Mycoplasma elephantis]|uniref:RluA family pseudouridine synthase n=1 Tax=Mycoplasma elephantis TaxID=114882 RepID=UPI0004896FE5|nr:RluA family pseudouridine synthase [Mycoplasma elephantis]
MIEIKVKYKERIDKYISDNSEISRNDIKELIKLGAVQCDNDIVRKPNYIPKIDSIIKITKLLDKEIKLTSEKIDFEIIFQNENYIIINKPNNLVVHPSPSHPNNTLVNGLLYYFKNNLSNNNGLLRPGIVHRIDKDTTGLLLIAKNNIAHNYFAEMIKNHQVKREYLAIVENWPDQDIYHINLPIGRDKMDRKKMGVTNIDSKNAITHIYVLKKFEYNNKKLALVKCILETGRTHQIRVHLNYINYPVYNDPTYGNKENDFHQYLHAYKLSFCDPFDSKNKSFFAKPPKEFDISMYDFLNLKNDNRN